MRLFRDFRASLAGLVHPDARAGETYFDSLPALAPRLAGVLREPRLTAEPLFNEFIGYMLHPNVRRSSSRPWPPTMRRAHPGPGRGGVSPDGPRRGPSPRQHGAPSPSRGPDPAGATKSGGAPAAEGAGRSASAPGERLLQRLGRRLPSAGARASAAVERHFVHACQHAV
jgi:hypothetical protein